MTELSVDQDLLSRLPLEDGHPIFRGSSLRVERLLYAGALSAVYLAHHNGFDEPVLLRVLRPEAKERIEKLDVLFKQCSKAAQVRHQNIAAVLDMGTYEEFPFMVLEYVDGVPMCERLKERPYSEAEALKLLAPIADGLSAYWRRGLLHRGVSPHRVTVNTAGQPVLDLVILPPGRLEPLLMDAHGRFMAGFWPPEELRGSDDLDARSDMYSFGATLYFALTGSTPAGMGGDDERITRTLTRAPEDPRDLNPRIGKATAEFVMQCIQQDRNERFASVRAFRTALRQLEDRIGRVQTSGTKRSGSGESGFKHAAAERTVFTEGQVIGNCQLVKQVGQGAFGIVYRARHRTLDVDVAVKLLPLDIVEKDEGYVNMFLREARTAARIRNPNVIGIFEAGEQDGQYYLVMEFAPGGSVLDKMDLHGGKLSADEVLPILDGTARALAAAGALNIVHRDIKPENLMFGADGQVKLADLGLAKRLAGSEDDATLAGSIVRDQLTMQDASKIMGTPAYMAPEMALTPTAIDTRADQYSLGCTAYHMLTGQLVFTGGTALETILKHVKDEPIPPAQLEPSIPAALNDLIMRLLEKNPEDRFPNAQMLVDAIEKLAVPA